MHATAFCLVTRITTARPTTACVWFTVFTYLYLTRHASFSACSHEVSQAQQKRPISAFQQSLAAGGFFARVEPGSADMLTKQMSVLARGEPGWAGAGNQTPPKWSSFYSGFAAADGNGRASHGTARSGLGAYQGWSSILLFWHLSLDLQRQIDFRQSFLHKLMQAPAYNLILFFPMLPISIYILFSTLFVSNKLQNSFSFLFGY
jgi:hypothetical protein